uniref:MADF domain-containing protein n=1 Tax=Anopheles epiroticus TaxID=199890 RepID=A0A182P513_9DIPT
MDESTQDSPLFSEPKLIELVKRKPLLWNHKDPYYNNRKLERDCWAEIGDLLDTDVESCKKKWQSLRNQYRRELYCRTTPSKWKHYNRLSFLATVLNSKVLKRPPREHIKSEDEEDPIRVERPETPMEQNSSYSMEELCETPYSNGLVTKIDHKSTPSTSTLPATVGNVAKESNYHFALSLVGLLDSVPKRKQLAVRIAILSKINDFLPKEEDATEDDKNDFL